MDDNHDQNVSCGRCLQKFIELDANPGEEEWDELGRGKTHCELCISALKDKHSEASE